MHLCGLWTLLALSKKAHEPEQHGTRAPWASVFLTPILVQVEDPHSVSSHDILRERVIRFQQPRIMLPDKLSVGFISPQSVLPGRMHVSAGKKPTFGTCYT